MTGPDVPAGGCDAAAAARDHCGPELLDTIVNDLFDVGISLQTAIDLTSDVARQRISAAIQHLDDTIRAIRDHVLAAGGQAAPRHRQAGRGASAA